MKIEQLMHDIADQPAPPSRLNAETVYNAGRRRRRRRTHRTYGGLLVATALASVGVLGANAQNFDALPLAPASDSSAPSVDADASADVSADADARAGADAGADAEARGDSDARANAEARADSGVDAEADADVDAPVDVSVGADADASAEATAPAVPGLPTLACDKIAAAVKAELAAHGLGGAGEAQVSCQDGTVDVVVSGIADLALTGLTVHVALVEAAAIEDTVCAGAEWCEHTAAGVLARTTGEIALGRTDGLVIRIDTHAEQAADLPGIDQAVPTAVRDLTLALGESLPTP